jgi:hypothetical protein
MAVHKATRAKSSTQTQIHRTDHQTKAELFDTLRHLNRGYGVALAALDKLETKDRLARRRVFPAGFLREYRNRTEGLCALANHDVLLLVAGREREEAERFNCVSGPLQTRERKRRS